MRTDSSQRASPMVPSVPVGFKKYVPWAAREKLHPRHRQIPRPLYQDGIAASVGCGNGIFKLGAGNQFVREPTDAMRSTITTTVTS